MLFNILYYDRIKETESVKSSPGLTLGPINITFEQVCVTLPERNEPNEVDRYSRLELVSSWSCCH